MKEGDNRFGFALLAALAMGGTLLVVAIKDPSRVAVLEAALKQSNERRDAETVRNNAELAKLQEALKQNQDALISAQKELTSVLNALRLARDQLDARQDDAAQGGRPVTPPANRERSAPEPVKSPAPRAETVSEELRGARLQTELAAIRRAVIANAREYLPLANDIARARWSLALARHEPATAMPEAEGEARERWRLTYLDREEAAELEEARRQSNPPPVPMPQDMQVLLQEISSATQALQAAQLRLSRGQKTLSSLQEDIARAR